MPTLPLELWSHIASFLPLNSRFILASTSKRIASSVYDPPGLWSIVHIEPVEDAGSFSDSPNPAWCPDLYEGIATILLTRLSSSAKLGVRTLILDNLSVRFALLTLLLPSFPRLECVSLRDCTIATLNNIAAAFSTLAHRGLLLPSLSHLFLNGSPQLQLQYIAGPAHILTPLNTTLARLNPVGSVALDITACDSCHLRWASPHTQTDPMDLCAACKIPRPSRCINCQSAATCDACDRPLCLDCAGGPIRRVVGYEEITYCTACAVEHTCSQCANVSFVRWGEEERVCEGCDEIFCGQCVDKAIDPAVVYDCRNHEFRCEECRPGRMTECQHCRRWGCNECAEQWKGCQLCSFTCCGCRCEIGYPYNNWE